MLLSGFSCFSQKLSKDLGGNTNERLNDSVRSRKSTSNKNLINKDAKITDYLIVSHLRIQR